MSTGLWVYLGAALATTAYQGTRGFLFQYWGPDLGDFTKTCTRRVWMLCISDAIFHSISCASGFAALWALGEFGRRVGLLNSSPTVGALIVFLALYGLLGVTGQLPFLIQTGKLSPFTRTS